MQQLPNRQTLELVRQKTASLLKIAMARELVKQGVLVNPTAVQGTIEKLLEVLNGEIPHRPKRP